MTVTLKVKLSYQKAKIIDSDPTSDSSIRSILTVFWFEDLCLKTNIATFLTCRRYLSNLKPKRWGNEKISKVVIIGERTLLIPNLKKLSDLDRPGDLSYVPIKCQECY